MKHHEKVEKLFILLKNRYKYESSIIEYVKGMLQTHTGSDVVKMIDLHLDGTQDWISEHGPNKEL